MSSFSLHFPPFRLDPRSERLWRETMEIPLRPKTFAVLRYLVEHAEQLVTKKELLNAVWGETVVGEDALTGCIRDLRKALGDEARRPQYIETVHRRGFRFIGQVVSSQAPVVSREEENHKPVPGFAEETNGDGRLESNVQSFVSEVSSLPPNDLQTSDATRPALDDAVSSHFWQSKSFLLAAVLLLAVTLVTVQYQHPTPNTQPLLPLPDKPSIAVLPFANMSNDPGQEYFSDGLTDDLITDLSRIATLFVIARNSTFTYKGRPTKVQEISRELGVRRPGRERTERRGTDSH